jgi:hypothetical protein
MDRQMPDVAARELERAHDERVGRDGDLRALDGHERAVAQRLEIRVAEAGQEALA